MAKQVKQTKTLKSKKIHLTKEMLSNAIKGSYGILTAVANKLHCERNTVYTWLEKYPELKHQLEDERQKIIDLAEVKLVGKVNEGSESMIALVVKTLGKDRGYVEKQEIQYSEKIDKLIDGLNDI